MSNITKNVESLELYNKFKIFLDDLPSIHVSKEEREERERIQNAKKAKIERDRLAKEARRNNQSGHGNRSGSQGRGQGKGMGKSGHGFNKSQGIDRQAISDELDNELNIQSDLRYIIEEDDNDLRLNFNEPNELMQIFQQLGENNLVEIQRMQETETELENMRQLRKQKKIDFDREIAELQARDTLEKDRIQHSISERNSLLGFREEDNEHTIDEYTMS